MDGNFLVNDAFENVTVRLVMTRFFLDYATPFMKWSEEVIALRKES
jgi:hypothetical protein